jgi:hypothetical protein
MGDECVRKTGMAELGEAMKPLIEPRVCFEYYNSILYIHTSPEGKHPPRLKPKNR